MCGVATTTRRLVDKVREVNPRVRVAATRKTLPGLRWFEKRAVKVGGGDTHRYDLSSLILIKDNHLALLGDLAHTIKLARERTSFALKIEVEVTAPEEAVTAAGAGADIVMLDNMTPTEVKAALEALERAGLRQRVIVEASGGIDAANILDYVRAGVDVVSIGALTDSAKAIDLSLEVEKV
jgi:nicotinate-nucleotide pyrophosphorylase (carboxylating)